MTNSNEDRRFIEEVVSENLLEASIEWIKENLDPDQVFDTDDMAVHVAGERCPEEVFPEDELQKWAEENGYIKDA